MESAHGGSGSRKVYADAAHVSSTHLEAFTRGWLPSGSSFDWHDHEGIEEIMVVVHGNGLVHDADGEYPYAAGDVFVFPADTLHKITNPSSETHEMLFVRVKV